MTTSNSRTAILERIRNATRNDSNAYADIPRAYIRRGSLSAAARIDLMIERLREYGADVIESSSTELPAAIAQQLESGGHRNIVAPAGVPSEWLVPGFNWKSDNDLTHDEIEQCDGVITAASAAIADSGTIVLHHSGAEGRRVLTLLPDWHLCILRASEIVETLPEYFARYPQPPRLATYISGPSATADIEMTRIKGVHGPRHLSVIIMRNDS